VFVRWSKELLLFTLRAILMIYVQLVRFVCKLDIEVEIIISFKYEIAGTLYRCCEVRPRNKISSGSLLYFIRTRVHFVRKTVFVSSKIIFTRHDWNIDTYMEHTHKCIIHACVKYRHIIVI
jgi:hypothetical protein